nr:hypothetical protein [Lachnospiraceae bacterium]
KSMEYFLMTHQWVDIKKQGDFKNILTCLNNVLGAASDNKVETSKEEVSIGMETGKKKKKMIAAALIISAVIIGAAVFLLGNNGISAKKEQNSSKNSIKNAIKVGDTITFGTYKNEEIEWRVLRLSEDKTEAVLISKNILCMKAYDAAESGKYNFDKEGNSYYGNKSEVEENQQLQVQVIGNNDWSLSNIRTWLNSSDEVVKYDDQAPTAKAMSELKNGYNNEPGFLYDFQESEIAAIKVVENETAGNELSGQDIVKTKDKVYLLSLEELNWFEEAGISVLAEPTQAAMESDDTKWYDTLLESYSNKEYYWWLREPVEGTSGKNYLVGNGYLEENLFEMSVGLEGYGIRPVITVYIDKLPG